MKGGYCRIYIARHGETEWNEMGLLQGQTDTLITPNGLKQAQMLKDKLRLVKIDAIFSSDLKRAVSTAEIVALEKDIIVKTNHLLREKSFGKYEGEKLEVFQKELKKYTDIFEKLSEKEKMKFKFPTMESDEDVVTRFIAFIRKVVTKHKGKTVLVVTHGTIIGSFLVHLGLFNYENRYNKKINNAGYFILESDGVNFFVKEADGIDL